MTGLTFTTAVILLLYCAYPVRTGRAFNCLFSRLDILDCIPHENTSRPEPNEYALYRTFIRNRVPDCIYRDPNANSKFEIIRPINNLDNPNLRLLYSPGYLLNGRYANSMLVHYNVQCPEGGLPFLVYNDLRLRGKECYGRCEDYVTISCADCATSESCGTEPTNNYYNLWQEHFSVTFRTSRAKNDYGFQLGVICFNPINMNKPDNPNSDRKKKRDLEIYHNIRQKYTERNRRQEAAPELPPLPIYVSFGDVVTYRDNTITVSRGGETISSTSNIDCLVVSDASGGDRFFLSDAVELRPDGVKETIQLRGPGELLVLSSNATFLRDSQTFTPSGTEKRVVAVLTNELLNVIPPSNDLRLTEELDEDENDEPDPTESQPQVPSHLISQRSAAVTPFPRRLICTSAIRLALLYQNSSNPVVSTIATSVLSIATRQSPYRVESVRRRLFRTPC